MVLHYYGEGDKRRAVEAHLSECAACRDRLEALTVDMLSLSASDVPERGEDYGAQVWARLQRQLVPGPTASWWTRAMPVRMTWPRLALAGAFAVLIVAAFVAGRTWRGQAVPVSTSAEAPAAIVRERILLVAVGDHLERSRLVLAEISNGNGGGAIDISSERATAQDLVATNRLYRQTAAGSGDPAMASALEELERTLVEIANSPSDASAEDVARLRERIESQGLIFKVTVLGSQVRQRQRDAVAPAPAGTKAST